MNKNNKNLTYAEWMEEVDNILISTVGLDQNSMADWLSRDSYDSGATALDGARDCLLAQDMLSEEEIDALL